MPADKSGMVVTVGENVVDIFKQGDGLLKPVPGGSPLNIAVAMGRLGVRASYAMPLSEDSFGTDMLAYLSENNVAYLPTSRVPRPSGLAMVAVSPDGQPDYSFYRTGSADTDLQPGELPALSPDVTHLQIGGSPALGDDHCGDMLLEWALQADKRVSLSLDPNVRPALIDDHGRFVERCEKLHRRCKISRMSDEDAQYMYNTGDPVEVTERMHDQGVELAILTLGANGAYFATRSLKLLVPVVSSLAVHDTVGAGDCFYGALLATLFERGLLGAGTLADVDEAQLREIGTFACACAALNCTQVGCNPPAREEVDQLAAQMMASD